MSVRGNPSYQPPAAPPANTWMLTFADLLSLLLTFFVLFYAMSAIKQDEWEAVSTSFGQRFNPIKPIEEFTFSEELSITHVVKPMALDLSYMQGVLTERLGGIVNTQITMRRLDDRLVLSLASDLLFTPGSAEIAPHGVDTLAIIGDALGNINNRIAIEGHTDGTPVTGRTYPSNWELSLARADRVAARIYAAGYTYPIETFGLADTRMDEISPEITGKPRDALARRVDIILRATLP